MRGQASVLDALQIERLIRWRGLTQQRAKAMMAAQMPIDEKRRQAHHVIDNSGSIEKTRAQTDQLWAQLTFTPRRPS